MLTRREVLRGGFAAACAAGGALQADQRVTAMQRTCFLPKSMMDGVLAEESAHGFRSLLPESVLVCDALIQGRAGPGALIILPAVRTLRQETIRRLRQNAEDGAWVIWERAANFSGHAECDSRLALARFFGISISDPIRASSTYIRYRWPITRTVRGFHDSVRVKCLPGERIAECAGEPVCIKRRVGKGGIVFLGAMLGPNIRAEEREARALGQTLLQSCSGVSLPLDVNRFA